MLIVGTSGWMYDDWREAFYPPALARREWLGYYAAQLPAVELNNSFYRLGSLEQFESWASTVPVGFRFAVKVSRYLSHVKRLREPDEPIERFLEHAAGLGPAFGPSLLQLPPTLQCDPDRLRGVLRRWPTGQHRLAIEFRHESWFTDEVRRLLADANVALCLTERRNHRPEPPWVTADWGYLRLHEGTATPWPTSVGWVARAPTWGVSGGSHNSTVLGAASRNRRFSASSPIPAISSSRRGALAATASRSGRGGLASVSRSISWGRRPAW